MKKVLFVCLGNICRSPMAEGLLRKYAADIQLPLMVDSAATSRWEVGNPPHPGTQNILRQAGVDFSQMRARQITPQDFIDFDYIIAMDENNLADLKRIAPADTEQKLHLYMEVVPGEENQTIADPYYTGDFATTYQMINDGLAFWTQKFRADS